MKRKSYGAALALICATAASAGFGSDANATVCVNPFDGTVLSPTGDVNGDGIVNVVDAHCTVLYTLWQLGGSVGPAPACAAPPPSRLDVNCSGTITVTDVTLVVNLALNLGLSSAVDPEQDGCANPCQPQGWVARSLVVPVYAAGVSAGGDFVVEPIGGGAATTGTSTGTVGTDTISIMPRSAGDPQEIP